MPRRNYLIHVIGHRPANKNNFPKPSSPLFKLQEIRKLWEYQCDKDFRGHDLGKQETQKKNEPQMCLVSSSGIAGGWGRAGMKRLQIMPPNEH